MSAEATPGLARLLGVELRRLREQRGWNLRDLVEHLAVHTGHSISTQAVTTYEVGTRAIGVERLFALCATLGARPSQVCAAVEEQLGPGLGLRVDLRQLVNLESPDLMPVRGWARACLDGDGDPVVSLTPTAVGCLAQVCSLPVEVVSAAIRAAADEEHQLTR